MTEEMLIFNTGIVVLLIVLYFLHVQIDCNNQIVLDRFRFKYFALRDRLAMLVIEGKLDEDSWEYEQVIDAINFHITTVETLSITDIIKQLIAYHSSPEERRKVKIMKKKVDHPEVNAILIDLFKTTIKLLKRNSRIQFYLMHFAAKRDREVVPFNQVAPIKNAVDNLTEYQEDLTLEAA